MTEQNSERKQRITSGNVSDLVGGCAEKVGFAILSRTYKRTDETDLLGVQLCEITTEFETYSGLVPRKIGIENRTRVNEAQNFLEHFSSALEEKDFYLGNTRVCYRKNEPELHGELYVGKPYP